MLVATAVVVVLAATNAPLLTNTLLGRQPDDGFLLANHQLVKPWGTQTFFKGRPVDMAMDPSKRWMAVLSGKEILVLDAASGSRVDSFVSNTTSYTGIAFTPDGKEIWASEAPALAPTTC